ncbi:hypothetical protein [Mesorhizobium carmichaelinearum]|uniref:hypothetical protein n=1 Tax=Mesorhizobium carmichaelinearum TaxID=1208188 RepID=UPI000BA3B4A8|nr:hypothetical protein [Mesorhizobium carmichaelinearum]
MFAPSGFLTVLDALNELGRELFNEKWTGKENSARARLITAEQYELDKITPGTGSRGSAAGFPGRGGPGRGFYIEPDPLKRYPFGDPHSDEYKAELAARERLETARVEMHRRLEATAMVSSVLDTNSGVMKAIDAATWRRADAPSMIEGGWAPSYSNGKGVLLIAKWPQPTAAAKVGAEKRRTVSFKALRDFLSRISDETKKTEKQFRDAADLEFPDRHIPRRLWTDAFATVPASSRRGRGENDATLRKLGVLDK